MIARRSPRGGRPARAGVTLVEVLVAIYITGVGLQSLLAVFPLGLLTMHQAIKDDRARTLADDGAALSRDGAAVLAATGDFLADALKQGRADPGAAAKLRAACENLDDRAADLEDRLADLEPAARRALVWQPWLDSMDRLKALRAALGDLADLLDLLENFNPPS